MRHSLNLIATFFILTFFATCKDSKFSDSNIEKQALKISELLDSNSIQVFYKWNYEPHGGEIWRRISGRNTIYTCLYRKAKDTTYLTIYQPLNFVTNFPSSLSFNTSKFWQFNFDMCNNKIFRIRFIDKHGEDRVRDTSVSVNKIFVDKNPYDTLNELSALKYKLGVYGITYRSDLGEFVEFWLSSQHKLTYLPDSLHLNPQFQKA